MQTLDRRLAGFIVVLLGAVTLACWIARDGLPPAKSPGPANETAATRMGAAHGAGSATRNVEEPRIDTAEVEEAFYFPFLGKVKSQMKVQEVTTRSEDGSTWANPFRVFTDERGQFCRAEFAQNGTDELEWPVMHIQEAMEATQEKVLGLPKTPPPISWQAIVAKVAQKVPMQSVKRMNVTYVDYQFSDRPPMAVFVVNVFGVDAMPPPRYPFMSDEKWRRTRFMFDPGGELFLMDSCL